MRPLPDGWVRSRLGDVVKLKYGKSLPAKSRAAGAVPVYGSNGVVGFHNQSLTHFPVVVIGRKGSVGEVAFCEEACWPIDTTYFVDEFSGHWPKFWYYALRFLQLGTLDRATAIPGLNREDAYALEVSFPPPAEQKRIADKLDRLLAAVDTCKARLDAIPAILKRFRQSVLAAATSGVLTEEWRLQFGFRKDWLKMTLKDVCSRVSVGHVGETAKHYTDAESGVPFLRSQNVRPGRIDIRGLNYITRDFHQQLRKSQLQVGDLLVVRVGANRGDSCVLPDGWDTINCANIVFARPAGILPAYLEVFFQSPKCQHDLLGRSVGGAQGVINTRSVERVKVDVPPESEQVEIVRRVRLLFSLADETEAKLESARVRLAEQSKAILSKALVGDLWRLRHETLTLASSGSVLDNHVR